MATGKTRLPLGEPPFYRDSGMVQGLGNSANPADAARYQYEQMRYHQERDKLQQMQGPPQDWRNQMSGEYEQVKADMERGSATAKVSKRRELLLLTV